MYAWSKPLPAEQNMRILNLLMTNLDTSSILQCLDISENILAIILAPSNKVYMSWHHDETFWFSAYSVRWQSHQGCHEVGMGYRGPEGKFNKINFQVIERSKPETQSLEVPPKNVTRKGACLCTLYVFSVTFNKICCRKSLCLSRSNGNYIFRPKRALVSRNREN